MVIFKNNLNLENIMAQSYELRPNKKAFITYRFIIHSICSFIISFLILPFFFHVPLTSCAIVFVLWELFDYYSLNVRYKKERYIFLPEKIVYKSGGIFSDKEVELVIKNITHVKMKLPYIESRLFKTGSIGIEAAGSGATEIVLKSIDYPERVYDYIIELMRYNGFKLTKSKLIQQEKPTKIGVFFETFKFFIVGVMIIFYLFRELLLPLSPPIAVIIIFILAIISIFKYLDLKNRVYIVYSDTLIYEEGFLTKHYAFLPIENLSDSTLTQTFIDKIFGLYDVKISCQGSQQEIYFKNMANGVKLKENLNYLIKNMKSLSKIGLRREDVKPRIEPTIQRGVLYSQTQREGLSKPASVSADTTFTAEYRMDKIRTIIPPLLMLIIGGVGLVLTISLALTINRIFFLLTYIAGMLLLPTLFSLIWGIIKVIFTTYSIKENSIEERYNFLSQRSLEFNNDKVMAVVFKENFIDKRFNTCSIYFYSIGSDKIIKFLNIKKTPNLYELVLAKFGIREENVRYQITPKFNVLDMGKANFFTTVLLIPLTLIISIKLSWVLLIFVILFLIAVTIYSSVYYKKSKLIFYNNYIYFTRGIFFKDFYYVLYDNVKDIMTTKYPLSRSGSIRFNIAGEYSVKVGEGETVRSNHFTIKYVSNIKVKRELMDIIFYYRPNAEQIVQIEQNIEKYTPKTILSAKPSLMNMLVPLIVISIVIFPLIPTLIITIPLTILWVRSITYSIQPPRIIAKSGIIYKKQTSILFKNINYINYSQGFLNKIFKNGNVVINTTGSSAPELIVRNIRNFKEFYDVLNRYYK